MSRLSFYAADAIRDGNKSAVPSLILLNRGIIEDEIFRNLIIVPRKIRIFNPNRVKLRRARAQKRIDDVVDRLSLIGKATYTSTLVRDPKTRRVRTIVRELSVTSAPQLGHTLKEAFREETKNATRSTQKQEKGTFQQWLTFENKSRESVYRLSVEASGAAEVTIVVKIK